MSQVLYPVHVTKQKRKHIQLMCCPDFTISVKAPFYTSEHVINSFIQSKYKWIEKTMASYQHYQHMVFPNPIVFGSMLHYLGKPLKVVLMTTPEHSIFIEDDNQQVMSFMNGDYDIYPWSRAQWWVERFTPEKYNEIDKGWVQKIKIFNFLPKGPSGLVFNTQKPLYDDIKIRKAFAHLFDVEKLNKRLFFNEYVRLNTFFYGTPYANPNNPYIEYNPEKALELLNDAGWSRKEGEPWLSNINGEIFEFDFLMSPGDERIFSTLQDDLKKVGIKMNFDQVDGNMAFSKTMKKEYEITYQGWTAGFFPNPQGMMHSKFANEIEVTNITSMAIPEIDKLIDQYNAEWDAKKRVPLAHQIDSIAVNSYHYALGWTSPYGARMLYWNKFGMPDKGLYYAGGWQSPITLWWMDPVKEHKLINAKQTDSQLPIEKQLIDYWNREN